jgi:hypothetical protein
MEVLADLIQVETASPTGEPLLRQLLAIRVVGGIGSGRSQEELFTGGLCMKPFANQIERFAVTPGLPLQFLGRTFVHHQLHSASATHSQIEESSSPSRAKRPAKAPASRPSDLWGRRPRQGCGYADLLVGWCYSISGMLTHDVSGDRAINHYMPDVRHVEKGNDARGCLPVFL